MGFFDDALDFLGDVAEGAAYGIMAVKEQSDDLNAKGCDLLDRGNYSGAFEAFEKAVELGNATAARNLGLCYECGYGTKVNSYEAAEYYKLAIKHGYSKAENDLKRLANTTEYLVPCEDGLYAVSKGFITKYSLSNVSCNWDGDNYTNRKVTIKIGRLQNESPHHSGSIKLCFYFCKNKFTGENFDGELMAESIYSKEGCEGQNYGWSNINPQMEMNGNPSTGDYFPLVSVLELDEDGSWYRVGYYNNFNKLHWNHEEPGKSTDCLIKKDDLYAIRKGFITDFSMSDVSYEWDGDNYTNRRVTIRIGRLQNEAIHHSGSIKLSFRFCNTKYSGGTIDGYLMASDIYSKEGCRGEQYGWNDVEFTMDMDGNPPTGDYFPILTVNELDEDGSWYIVGYCNFDNKQHWNHEEDALGVDDMISLADEHWNNEEYEEAAELFLEAAEQGNAYAQYSIGFCYEKGVGTNQAYRMAVEWYKKSAKQGYADAQCQLGHCYYNGNGIPQNYSKAVEWYQNAAEQGSASAQYSLGYCYLLGNGVEKCEKEGVRWFRKAAEQGHSAAQYGLGICHEEGTGVKQSYGEAIGWYRKAAKQGDEDAKEAIERVTALMKNQNNTNTTVEERTYNSFDDLKEAAEQGNADAQLILGLCYYNGDGVWQNYEEAFLCFKKAANQGNAEAQYFLGLFYEKGIGVAKNEAKAVEWYQKAAEQGDAIAHLGEMYEKGQGVNQNYNKALELYNQAFENGFENAKEGIDRVSAILNGGNVESTATHSDNEQEYIETLKEIIADDGEITDRERRLLEKLRTKLGISESRAKELEQSLSNPTLTAEEQEYLDEYKSILADGEITDKERKLLDKIRKMSGISEGRAREIEKMA